MLKFQLKQHLMDHGGKRPYPCPECSFTCKTKQQLNEHRRKHSVSVRVGVRDVLYSAQHDSLVMTDLYMYCHLFVGREGL